MTKWMNQHQALVAVTFLAVCIGIWALPPRGHAGIWLATQVFSAIGSVAGIALVLALPVGALWLERKQIKAHPWQHGIGIPLFLLVLVIALTK